MHATPSPAFSLAGGVSEAVLTLSLFGALLRLTGPLIRPVSFAPGVLSDRAEQLGPLVQADSPVERGFTVAEGISYRRHAVTCPWLTAAWPRLTANVLDGRDAFRWGRLTGRPRCFPTAYPPAGAVGAVASTAAIVDICDSVSGGASASLRSSQSAR